MNNRGRILSLILAALLIIGTFPSVYADDDTSFLSWKSVYGDNFSDAPLNTTVHGRKSWTVSGDGSVSNMTVQAQNDPENGENRAMQLERHAAGEYAAATYSFADTAEEELTGKVYVSADFYVKTWSSFEISVQTSNTTPLVRAYITSAKDWRNNAGWAKVAPASGQFSENAWFTLGILLDTAAGTYDLYLNDEVLTNGVLTKQGTAALLKTNRGVGKIKFDIDAGQSSGNFLVDNLVIKSENAKEDEPESDTKISGKEVYVRHNFNLSGPGGLGETIIDGVTWSKRNKPINPALYWTLEQDPDNPAGLPFSQTNQVLRARRVRQGTANEWAFTYIKAGGEVVEARGKVHVRFKIKPEYADNNFIVRMRNNASTDGWGNELLSCIIRPSGQVIELGGWNGIGKLKTNAWNTMEFIVDTENRNYELYVNDVRGHSEPINFAGSGYDSCVSVFEWDIEKRSNGENVWYMDDLEVWTDHTDELTAAAKQLSNALRGGEISEDIVLPQLDLGDLYTVKWTADKPDVISSEGKVTQRAYTQTSSLTAEIIRNAERPYAENAKAVCSFDFTVLPKTNASDEELLTELKNNYYTDGIFTDENLQEITKSIRIPPANGPEGVSVILESDDSAIDAVTGAVLRPSAGEEARHVTLTLKLTKNAAYAEKQFVLTVLPQKSDSDMLNEAEQWLKKERLTTEDYGSLKYGLVLPVSAPNGTVISWSTDSPESISADGKVYRQNESKNVTLTALLTAGSESRTVTYSFTVMLSPVKMAELDAAKLELSTGDTSAVKDNFPVSAKGSLYQSDIVWSSNNTDVIKIENGSAIVTQPPFEQGDAKITLTAFVRNETASAKRTFEVTVPAMPSDDELVTSAAEWLTWSLISLDDKTSVKHNLALPDSYDGGVSITWESSSESTVSTDGKVSNPPIGGKAEEVTLKALITKNQSTHTKKFTFSVPPFASPEEVLQSTKDNLSFYSLGGQKINEVTENLTLPRKGAGGAQISWSSSNPSRVAVSEYNEDLCIGFVTRPGAGGDDEYVTLTATITYGSETAEKSFVMTVKAAEDWNTVYEHSYDDFSEGDLPTYPGEAVWPTEAYLSYRVAYDPTGEDNKAALLYRAANAPHIANESWYFYRHKNSALYDGELTFSGRMYLDENLKDIVWIDIVAKNGSQICMGFYPDGKIGCQYTDGGVLTAYTNEPVLKKGQWMNFSVNMDSSTKTYHIYLDGECVTENGKMTVNNAIVNLPWGIHYNYFQDSSRSTQIQGWRIYYLGKNAGEESFAYFDDISLKQKVQANSKLIEARTNVERDLLSLINPNAVTKSFTMPEISSGSVKLKWHSSDAAVLRSDGTVFRGETDRKVTLTAELTLGAETIYRPFELIIKSIYADDDMTDAEAVLADAENALQALQKKYNLSALSENIILPAAGNYGSALAWKSSNTDLMSDTGVLQSKGAGSLSLTVTAKKGDAAAEKTIEITLKGKRTESSSGPMTVSGKNSSGNTGIVLSSEPDKDKKKFSDLPKDHWAYDAVTELAEKNVIQGTDDTHFEPERTVTRAEFAKMLVAAFDLIPKSTDAAEFTDVKKTDWYYQYVRTLSALGIACGMEDGSFGANLEITRQDIAVLLYRVLKYQNRAISDEITKTADWNTVEDYAKEAVGCLLSEGIIQGDENGNYLGTANATRAQAAALVYRSLKTDKQ